MKVLMWLAWLCYLPLKVATWIVTKDAVQCRLRYPAGTQLGHNIAGKMHRIIVQIIVRNNLTTLTKAAVV